MILVPRVPLDRPATYDDLEALPDHVVGEIIDGVLYSTPRPAPRHALAASRLASALMPPFGEERDGPGGWIILFEPELHLSLDVIVPDLAGWRRDRLPTLPDAAYFVTAPNWVCEVLSPSTAAIDRARKLDVYRRAGVEFTWLVDPVAQTCEVFVCDTCGWRVAAVHGGAETVRAEPFGALELRLADLWDLTPAPRGPSLP